MILYLEMKRKKRGRDRRMKRRGGEGSKAGMTAGSGNQAYISDPTVKEKTQTVLYSGSSGTLERRTYCL